MSAIATWSDLVYNISPYNWAYMGIALALGCSILGAAWFLISCYISLFKIGEFISLVQVLSEVLSKLPELDPKILSGKSYNAILRTFLVLSFVRPLLFTVLLWPLL